MSISNFLAIFVRNFWEYQSVFFGCSEAVFWSYELAHKYQVKFFQIVSSGFLGLRLNGFGDVRWNITELSIKLF